MSDRIRLVGFVQESNQIEGINRPITHPQTGREIEAHEWFLALDTVSVADLEHFVSIVQPDAVLRDKPGMNVQVGSYVAPPGGPEIRKNLEQILKTVYRCAPTPHGIHMIYENLHPFTDGNGRSGRVLWLWMMGGIEKAPLGFLHQFYYQTLKASS